MEYGLHVSDIAMSHRIADSLRDIGSDCRDAVGMAFREQE